MGEQTLATFQLKTLSLVKSFFTIGEMSDSPIEKEVFNVHTSHSKQENDIGVLVEVHIEVPAPSLKINAAYEGIFTTSNSSEEETEHFAKVNGPAIIFPSLRYHIRHITLEAGLPPLILPLINFTKIRND